MLDNASGKMVYTVIAMRTANEERDDDVNNFTI